MSKLAFDEVKGDSEAVLRGLIALAPGYARDAAKEGKGVLIEIDRRDQLSWKLTITADVPKGTAVTREVPNV